MATARPLIAIVGRPNVGKSRLFNRLTGSRAAIVEDTPGVTRDRHYGDGDWDGKAFSIVDTGGFEPDSQDVLLSQMREQAQLAIDEADIIFFMMDGRSGMTPVDQEIAQMLRVCDKLLFPIVNKIDGPRHDALVAEFYELGFNAIYGTSAEHGYQVGDLMDEVIDFLPSIDKVRTSQDDEENKILNLAVVGKPNAGKSTLINRLLGTDRLLTSTIPGTTRDAIDNRVVHDGREYIFIDTAGVRRRKSISLLIEKYAVVKAFKSIDRAEVAIYMLDATQGVTDQDKRLMRMTKEKGKPFMILVNKWDAVEDKDSGTSGEFIKELHADLPDMSFAPVVFVSALTGQRIHRIYNLAQSLYDQWSRRIRTTELNRWVETLARIHSPPIYKGRRVKLFFATQVSIRPPTFMFSANYPEAVAPSYQRFILNQMRDHFGFKGTPLKVFFRRRGKDQKSK
jgi:GTP-binding protein